MNIENQLFEWEGWQDAGVMTMQYEKCILVKDIGDFKKGDLIEHIVMDFENSIMEFYKGEKVIATFDLKLSAE